METFYARPQMRQVVESYRNGALDKKLGAMNPAEAAQMRKIMRATLHMEPFQAMVDTMHILNDEPSELEVEAIEDGIAFQRAARAAGRLAGVTPERCLRDYSATDEDREAFARAQRFQRLRFLVTL